MTAFIQKIKINLPGLEMTNLWRVAIFPFIATRVCWLLAAWYAGAFFQNLGYREYIERGYFLSSYFLVDIWTRWDSAFYLSIVEQGYTVLNEITSFTNLAFFPLYPYVIKGLLVLIPEALHSRTMTLAVGILLSNICFVTAILLLYKLISEYLADKETAYRTIILVFLFPTSFFFSCFYPESLFFLLALAVFTTAMQRRWLWACILGALAVVTRPQGILLAVPLAWLYMEARGWKLSAVRADVLWLLLLPASLLAHFYYLYTLTGNFFSAIEAQKVWGRNFGNILEPFFDMFLQQQTPGAWVDMLLLAIFLLLSIMALFHFRSKSYGLFALLMVLIPIMTGNTISISRHLVTIFPVFVVMAQMTKQREIFFLVCMVLLTFQIAFFIGWVNFYWIA